MQIILYIQQNPKFTLFWGWMKNSVNFRNRKITSLVLTVTLTLYRNTEHIHTYLFRGPTVLEEPWLPEQIMYVNYSATYEQFYNI